MKNELTEVMANVEIFTDIREDEIAKEKYMKLPLEKIPSLGVAFEPLASVFQNIAHLGSMGEQGGLYRLTFPEGVSGRLANFQDGSGFLGTIINKNGIVGQARLNPLAFNPTTMFMAVALMGIQQKLAIIQETQQDILEFLKQKEKAKLRGNLNTLMEILNNYKHNWNNEKYKTNKHILVQEIKRDAEQSISLLREQIDTQNNKKKFIHSDQAVKNKLRKIQSEFKDYQLALYLFSFSSFLEVMLLENFDSSYLESVTNKLQDYSYQYREFYTKCYDLIEGYSKSSINTHLLSGLANVNKVVGDMVAKVPLVNKSQIDKTFIDSSISLDKFNTSVTERTMEKFVNNQSSLAHPFIENINTVNRLYNQPSEFLFDRESIYFLNQTESKSVPVVANCWI